MRRPHSTSAARRTLGGLLTSTVLVAGALITAGSAQAAVGATTFGSTGADQTYVVPDGVTTVTVVLTGAPGGASGNGSGGGAGRTVTADLPVTPGQTLFVEVGGAGSGAVAGYNGGGAGGGAGRGGYPGGAGGGASDIRTSATPDSRLIVASGGGGGAINGAGNGDGAAPNSSFFADGGQPGTQTAGGAAGAPGNDGAAGTPGMSSVGGAGGPGVSGGTPGGGGGGGGYYGGGGGGGGGSSGGGGGGSSYVESSATNVSYGFGSAPSVTITPIIDVAPLIGTQPADTEVVAGATATFTASATGNPTPSVQWQVSTGGGWTDVPGATSTTLTLEGATADINGNLYRAVFTNTFGGSDHTAISDAAALTVGSAPAITRQPVSVTVGASDAGVFTAAANGNPSPTVQWQVSTDSGGSWKDVTGATRTTLTVLLTTPAMDGNLYRAVFTNTIAGTDHTATSDAATLTVTSAPFVVSQPIDTTVLAGATATFTAAATGNPSPTVQWQVSADDGGSWTDIPGATSTTLTVPDTTLAMTGNQYEAEFTNDLGGSPITATTDPASLTVDATPNISSQPVDTTVLIGTSATFAASATGNPSPTEQWQLSADGGKSWTDLSGATGSTLSVPAVTIVMSGNLYRAVFTNTLAGAAHTATTEPATLTVTAPPIFTNDTPPPATVVGVPYSFTFTATGAPAPTYSLGSGSLPLGLVLDPLSGVLTGTPTTAGRYTFTVTAHNSVGTVITSERTVTVRPALAITTGALPNGTVGRPYSTTLTTSGGDGAPDVWMLAPGSTLPAGLRLSRDGVISGTPSSAGTSHFTVSVNDPVTARLAITIVPTPETAPTTPSAPAATSTPTVATGPTADTGLPVDPIAWSAIALLLLLSGALTMVLARRRGIRQG